MRSMLSHATAILAVALAGTPSTPAAFEATNVTVEGGGRIVVRELDGSTCTVQLADIEAPGPSEPFGLQAMAALSAAVGRSTVTVTVIDELATDRCEVLGIVRIGDESIGLPLIREGLAFAGEHADDTLRAAQLEASRLQKGLWSDPEVRRAQAARVGGPGTSPLPTPTPEPDSYYHRHQKARQQMRALAKDVELSGNAVTETDVAPGAPTAAGTDPDPLGLLKVKILGRELVVTEVLGQTQDRGYRVKVSWRLRLHNPDARDQRAAVRIDFRNAHDLLLKTLEKTFTVPASATQLFEGFDELTLGTAEETASIDARVTSSEPVD